MNSRQTGDWTDPFTWDAAGIIAPTSADNVTVDAGDIVTVDVTTAQARNVTINGTLSFSRSVSSELTLSSGSVQINSGGTLDMGAAPGDPLGGPIPSNVTATLTLALGSGAQRYRLYMPSNAGLFTSRGADKDLVAVATGAIANLQGMTSLEVPASDAEGWAVGDAITIGATELTNSPWEYQTERRVISSTASAGANLQVSWLAGTCSTVTQSGNLCFNHVVARGVRVANLTRNVVIRSSGTNAAVDTAYVLVDDQTFPGFQAAQTEFSGLGTDVNHGVHLSDDWMQGSFTSCTFHGSSGNVSPLYVDSKEGIRLIGSVFHGNNSGPTFWDADDAVILGNDIMGASPDFRGNNLTISGNAFYSNGGSGLYLSATRGVMEGNRFYANNGAGLLANTGQQFHISSNDFSRNTGRGLDCFTCHDSVISGNTARSNNAEGIALFNGNDIILANNVASGNTGGNGIGFYFRDTLRVSSLSDRAYANNTYGIFLRGFAGGLLQDGAFGFDETGAPQNNLTANIGFRNDPISGSVRGCRSNNSLTYSGGQPTGNSLVFYGHEYSTGAVLLRGDYTVPSGSAFSMDNAQPLYRSSATTPKLYHGTNHTLTVTATDDATAVSQAVAVTYQGGQWRVQGSVTGFMGVYDIVLGGPQDFGQFIIDLNEFSPQEGDRLVFGLKSASKDAGVQKNLALDSLPGLNPRITVPPGASFSLRGAPSALLPMIRPGGSYTFISSGSVTLENARVENTNVQGLQLSGSGGVIMSSVTFDNIAAAGGAYVTAQDLTASVTSYNMVFNDTPNRTPFSVNVQGNDSGLRWYMAGFSGNRSGDMRDSDPNQKILWADGRAPNAPAPFTAASGANEGEINLVWTASADVENDLSTSTLKGGSFRIFRSTDPAVAGVAGPQDPGTVVISTTALPGTSHGRLDQGLLLGATYYYRLWAADEFGNPSSTMTAQAQAARFPVAPPSNFQAMVSSNAVALGWTAVAPPSGAYRGPYRLERSTDAMSGYATVATIPATSTAYVDLGLAYETDYYYRLYARDNGAPPLESAFVQASTRTAEVTDPAVTLFTVGPSNLGVPWASTMTLTFTKAMNAGSVLGAVSLTRIKDNGGNAVNEDLTGTLSIVVEAPDRFTVTPPVLQGNSTYELVVSTAAGDNFGKFLASSTTLRFTTLMDHTQPNVVTEGTGGAAVSIPPDALPADGYVRAATVAPGAAAATQKLVQNTGDPLRTPVPGGTVSLEVLDAFGVSQILGAPVTVTLPFPDVSPADGIVDGTSPPVRAKTLALYWLDETRNVWHRLPSSRVDPAARTVSAQAPRFAVFAAVGQADTDLSAAHAFPSPYVAGPGAPQSVTFTGLGQATTVRIYTPSGRLVREMSSSNGLGTLDWDLKNDDGEPVAAGLYLYRITSGDAVVTGKMAVVK